MSGETEEAVSGWTVDTLKAHLERIVQGNDLRYQQRFESQEVNLRTAIDAVERAVAKKEAADDKRFDGVNEFRLQLADQQRTFLPRHEYEARHDALIQQANVLASRLDRLEGTKGGSAQTFAWIAAGFGTLVGIAAVVVSIVTH